jgi:hypothetical protein
MFSSSSSYFCTDHDSRNQRNSDSGNQKLSVPKQEEFRGKLKEIKIKKKERRKSGNLIDFVFADHIMGNIWK